MAYSRIYALAFIIGFIFTFPSISSFSSVHTISNAFAQEKAATDETGKIKATLLRPGGYLVEWRGVMGKGEVDTIFEERGENVIAKINNAALNQACERIVTITPDGVKMDGCNDINILLVFDPNDQEYPFKGEGQNNYYKFKVK